MKLSLLTIVLISLVSCSQPQEPGLIYCVPPTSDSGHAMLVVAGMSTSQLAKEVASCIPEATPSFSNIVDGRLIVYYEQPLAGFTLWALVTTQHNLVISTQQLKVKQ